MCGLRGLLVGVFLDFVVKEFYLHAGLAEELFALGPAVVFAFADYAGDAAVDDEHGAGAAGGHTAVEGGAVEGDAATGGLADGVLLSMDGADTVGGDAPVGLDGFAEEVPHLVAMGEAGGRTDIAGDEELTVLDDDAAGAATVAGGTLGGGVGQFHEVFVPRGTAIHDFAQDLFHLGVEGFDGAIVVETVVGLVDAVAEVLLVGVVVVHLALLVGDEGLVVDMVGLAAAEDGTLVADAGVGIDGKEIEIRLAAQGIDFARGADALYDAVAAGGLGLVVELFDNPRGGMLCAKVVADKGHAVAVDFESATLDLVDEESADGVVCEAFRFLQVVDYGAFAGPEGACDADGDHLNLLLCL